MDIKEKQLLSQIHEKLLSDTFDELDVYNFLILVRDYGQKGDAAREFGDFVAHRSKDRGKIKVYLEDVYDKLVRSKGEKISIKVVYTVDEIADAYNRILSTEKLKPLPANIVQGIVLCIISILQNVSLTDKTGKKIGYLGLAYSITDGSWELTGNVGITWKDKPVTIVFAVLRQQDKHKDDPYMPVREVLRLIRKNGVLEFVQ